MENKDKNVLIVPMAGKSSRFPNMKPKYLLTHPNGNLMVEASLAGIQKNTFDCVVFTILEEHELEYNVKYMLDCAFRLKFKKVRYVTIKKSSSPADTIRQTLDRIEDDIDPETLITIKDSDGYVVIDYNQPSPYVAGLKIGPDSNVRNIQNKSFIMTNQDYLITDIVEKQIISDTICVGVYCAYYQDLKNALGIYSDLEALSEREVYMSEIFFNIIAVSDVRLVEVKKFTDFGTLEDWEVERAKRKTYFIDVDGVLVKNVGKYGINNWDSEPVFIEENVEKVKELYDTGAQIILTSSRDGKSLYEISNILNTKYSINIFRIVSECNHAERVIINDFAPTNSYPACSAINIRRNGNLGDYIQ